MKTQNFAMISFLKRIFQKKAIKLDLGSKTDLVFRKNREGKYVIYFFNPIKGRYWALPSSRAAIHAQWSFEKMGSYGAYNLQVFSCEITEVDFYRKKFETLHDIHVYFGAINEIYNEFKKNRDRVDKMPDVI